MALIINRHCLYETALKEGGLKTLDKFLWINEIGDYKNDANVIIEELFTRYNRDEDSFA